ncbi:eIF-2-alpha kinase GCN2-like [Cydia pomonella]|uniref:eIF-2-alpha kinase GCN2-like n=1 Tax=Cydia pomonella TaxID=82600 RepID=UPI002ADE2FB8|nr:eIF-2-alpha kinase GCN2-like [Cydia pomonella]
MNMDCNNNISSFRRSSTSTGIHNGQAAGPQSPASNPEDLFYEDLPIINGTANFDVISEHGEGSFGKVIKVQHKIDKQYYAIKRIPLEYVHDEITEAKLMSRLEHENIVRYYNSWIEHEQVPDINKNTGEIQNNNSVQSLRLCIQMEFCEYTLQQVMRSKRFKYSNNKLDYFWQILKGLIYLQRKGLFHRDLHDENILVDHEGCVKIADFGIMSTSADYNMSMDLIIILEQMFGKNLSKHEEENNNENDEITVAKKLYRLLRQPKEACKGERPPCADVCADLFKYYNENIADEQGKIYMAASNEISASRFKI